MSYKDWCCVTDKKIKESISKMMEGKTSLFEVEFWDSRIYKKPLPRGALHDTNNSVDADSV